MRLTLRADADASIGAGHVVRCVALAEAAMARGHQALLVTAALPEGLADALRRLGVEWRALAVPSGTPDDAAATLAAPPEPADWVFVDGYGFETAYQRTLRAGCPRLLILDDHAVHPRYEAAALLNPAGEELAGVYARVAPACELLLGPRYAPVQAEYARTRDAARPGAPSERRREPPRLLITMGAGDPRGLAALALDALDRLAEPLVARLVVGPLNPRLAELRQRAAASPHRLELVESPVSMSRHMRWADLALSAAGSTCWELACLGTPALVVPIADNQSWVARTLTTAGAAVDLGPADRLKPQRLAEELRRLLPDAEERAAMARHGRELVDGRGCERVLEYCRGRLEG